MFNHSSLLENCMHRFRPLTASVLAVGLTISAAQFASAQVNSQGSQHHFQDSVSVKLSDRAISTRRVAPLARVQPAVAAKLSDSSVAKLSVNQVRIASLPERTMAETKTVVASLVSDGEPTRTSRRTEINFSSSALAAPLAGQPSSLATTRPAVAPPIANSNPVKRNVNQLKFFNAQQFLKQQPQLQNPRKYLAQPTQVAPASSPANPPAFRRVESSKSRVVASRRQPTRRHRQDPVVAPRQTDRSTNDSSSEFADVNAPISMVPFGSIYQNDTSNLLVDDQVVKISHVGDDFNYSLLSNNDFMPSSKAWLAPDFAHQPLYFEETQLERYGNCLPLQSLASGVHFFSTIPRLPYMMGADRPYECQYTYGNRRPGECVPYDVYRRPLNKHGLLSQAFWASAIILP